jgi:hypothetical protein
MADLRLPSAPANHAEKLLPRLFKATDSIRRRGQENVQNSERGVQTTELDDLSPSEFGFRIYFGPSDFGFRISSRV